MNISKLFLPLAGTLLSSVFIAAAVTLKTPLIEVTAPDNKKRFARVKLKQVEWSGWLFEDLFGQAPPKGKVMIQNLGNDPIQIIRTPTDVERRPGEWLLPWMTDERPDLGNLKRGHSTAITHEVAHAYLAEILNPKATKAMRKRHNGYGGYVDDWFDEAIAVYHKPGGVKEMCRNQLLEISKKDRISLKKLFDMDHPIGANFAPSTDPSDPYAKLKDKNLTDEEIREIVEERSEGEKGFDANKFYVQNLAVIEYMITVGGRPFVRHLANHLAVGKTMDHVLEEWQKIQPGVSKKVSRHTNRPRYRRATTLPELKDSVLVNGLPVRKGEHVGPMPESVETMEEEFHRWISKSYRHFEMRDIPPFPRS